MSRFQFVADHRDTFKVKQLCETIEINRSSYYAWQNAAPGRAERAAADAALAERIGVFHKADKTYGAPRITADLNDAKPAPERVNHKRVARVMKENGIAGAAEYVRAEVVHAVTCEGALHLDDVLTRRTRISISEPSRGTTVATEVADLMAPLLGWDSTHRDPEIAQYRVRAQAELDAAQHPDDESPTLCVLRRLGGGPRRLDADGDRSQGPAVLAAKPQRAPTVGSIGRRPQRRRAAGWAQD